MKAGFRILKSMKKLALFMLFSIIIMHCSKEKLEQPEETILVNIDNKVTISKDEFIRRAEYTIRPPYCKMNTYLQKKIILNSLIAEKLLALETSSDNPLRENEQFKNFLKGRREQAMRQWMHYREATEKVHLDSAEVKKYYKFAGREFEIEYFSIKDSSLIDRVKNGIPEDQFETFYHHIYGDSTIPERIVTWKEYEHPKILHALFSQNVQKNQVLTPIEIAKDDYLIVKVKGWTDNKVITASQIQERYKTVSETLTNIKSREIWKAKVGQIMHGKTLDFNESVFWKLNELFFKMYFKTDEEKQDMIKESVWDLERNLVEVLDQNEIANILNQTFFTVDGKKWTVQDFRNELMSHPLVFRERKMPSNEFGKQFRLAVVDLVRDHYVTRYAYKKGYDKINVVQRNERMWRDAYLAIYQKNFYLNSIMDKRNFEKNYMAIIGENLNAYVDSLQQKYFKKVQLNFDEFEKMPLSSVDLYVKQKDQPYQHVVPRFPVLTTDNYIQYITRMK